VSRYCEPIVTLAFGKPSELAVTTMSPGETSGCGCVIAGRERSNRALSAIAIGLALLGFSRRRQSAPRG
jgi:hypothetical protein